MNDQLSGTPSHTGSLAYVPHEPPLPSSAPSREDIPGLVRAAPEGEEQLDADWLWDEVVGVAIAPHWSAGYILQQRDSLRREREQNLEASERGKHERAAAEAADPDRNRRSWIDAGAPEMPTVEDQLAALTRRIQSLEADIVLVNKRLFDLEETGKAPAPTRPGRIPRPPNGSAA